MAEKPTPPEDLEQTRYAAGDLQRAYTAVSALMDDVAARARSPVASGRMLSATEHRQLRESQAAMLDSLQRLRADIKAQIERMSRMVVYDLQLAIHAKRVEDENAALRAQLAAATRRSWRGWLLSAFRRNVV